jgi:hypothetical protein
VCKENGRCLLNTDVYLVRIHAISGGEREWTGLGRRRIQCNDVMALQRYELTRFRESVMFNTLSL